MEKPAQVESVMCTAKFLASATARTTNRLAIVDVVAPQTRRSEMEKSKIRSYFSFAAMSCRFAHHISEALLWRKVKCFYRNIILLQVFVQSMEFTVSPQNCPSFIVAPSIQRNNLNFVCEIFLSSRIHASLQKNAWH